MHCRSSERHLLLGQSDCETDWDRDEAGYSFASAGHSFYNLKCTDCAGITIWEGFVPAHVAEEEYSDEEREELFPKYYRCLYPEVRFTAAWAYSVPKDALSTKVQFFLGQAEKAASIGLYNAAILSFRSVLEAIVDEDKSTRAKTPKGAPITLGQRLKLLTSQSPLRDWVKHLDAKTLQLMKDLGNDAIHVRRLKEFTPELTDAMRHAIDLVLQEFYRDTKKAFKAAGAKIKKAKKSVAKVK